jgi:hypothetical protein
VGVVAVIELEGVTVPAGSGVLLSGFINGQSCNPWPGGMGRSFGSDI